MSSILKMSPVVAVCPVHGPFGQQGIVITDSKNVTLSGNSETCPRCGRRAKTMEGTFTFDAQGIATVLSGPEWTVDALRTVQGKVERVASAAESREVSDEVLGDLLDRLREELAEHHEGLAATIVEQTRDKPRPAIVRLLRRSLEGLGALVLLREAGGYTYEAVEVIAKQFFAG